MKLHRFEAAYSHLLTHKSYNKKNTNNIRDSTKLVQKLFE